MNTEPLWKLIHVAHRLPDILKSGRHEPFKEAEQALAAVWRTDPPEDLVPLVKRLDQALSLYMTLARPEFTQYGGSRLLPDEKEMLSAADALEGAIRARKSSSTV